MVMLEPKHILFDSVEEMLAPKTLTGLLSKPDCQPMNGHVGLAGSQFSDVDTNALRHIDLRYWRPPSQWIRSITIFR